MHPRHPLHDVIPKIALYARSLRLWAMELVVWWVGIFGDRAAKLNVRREIRDLARMTRILLLLAVAARLRFPARKRDIRRPFGARDDTGPDRSAFLVLARRHGPYSASVSSAGCSGAASIQPA